MSNTQGEQKQSVKSTIIGGALAIIAVAGVIGGVAVASDNARAQAEQLHLLSVAKTSSITMQAATADDAALYASTQQAAAVEENNVLAAQDQAAYDAKIAAEKAAAAKAAADAAAAQQAAQRQRAAQQQASADNGAAPVSGEAGLPAGSPVPWIADPNPQDTAGGRWDTGACASGSASGNPAVCD